MCLNRLILAVAALTLALGARAGQDFPSLHGSIDPTLQAGLERSLQSLGLWRAVESGKLGLAVADITDPAHPRVAEVNGDRMFYAASLPKIAILLGAFVEAERGRLALDDQTRDTLTRMIRTSSNRAATEMLNRVGKQRLADILQSDDYNLYDPALNGGLWVGKDYARRPAWRRDPLHNMSHGATAMQAVRFYYLMETNRLVPPHLTAEMKEMLANPGIEHKFVKGMAARPDARIFRKSGTWRRWHADSALIERGGRTYIVAALAEDRRGGEWLSRLIAPVDDLVARTALTGQRVAAR